MTTEASLVARPFAQPQLRSRRTQWWQEFWIRGMLVGSALLSIVTTAAIILVLVGESIAFFREVSVVDFFTSTQWTPLLGEVKHFGIWPLVSGTLLVTAIGMLVALPLGLVTAVYLSEYAPPKVRSMLKPTLEILAGIPTVVYGFFALTVITPGLQFFHGRVQPVVAGIGNLTGTTDYLQFLNGNFEVFNALSAGIAVGILCVPIVSSLAEDALHAVPRSLREAAYGVGGTKFDVSVKVVVPAALSGIVSAFLLAMARAIGETMIVALAAGNTPRMTVDPRESVQTMTGFMAQMAMGDVSVFSVEYLSMYAVAATLFAITFAFTLLGQRIRLKYREVYQ